MYCVKLFLFLNTIYLAWVVNFSKDSFHMITVSILLKIRTNIFLVVLAGQCEKLNEL